jgi:hypothetical protein
VSVKVRARVRARVRVRVSEKSTVRIMGFNAHFTSALYLTSALRLVVL